MGGSSSNDVSGSDSSSPSSTPSSTNDRDSKDRADSFSESMSNAERPDRAPAETSSSSSSTTSDNGPESRNEDGSKPSSNNDDRPDRAPATPSTPSNNDDRPDRAPAAAPDNTDRPDRAPAAPPNYDGRPDRAPPPPPDYDGRPDRATPPPPNTGPALQDETRTVPGYFEQSWQAFIHGPINLVSELIDKPVKTVEEILNSLGPGGAVVVGSFKGLGKLGSELLDAAVTTRISPRTGEKGVTITKSDGSVIDITPSRVKEFVPEPRNPGSGTARKNFGPDAQPGSKGFKRDPTPEELELLDQLTRKP